MKIVVPEGRTRSQLRSTLLRALEELRNEREVDAATVYAYRSRDDLDGAFTAGRVTWGPGGRWAPRNRSESPRADVELGDVYFAPESPTRMAIGDTVVLQPFFGDEVGVSQLFEDWSEPNIAGYLAAGDTVIIMDRQSEALTASAELVRYRVRALSEDLIGWVARPHVEGTDRQQ